MSRLPILMYHNVSLIRSDNQSLTILEGKLEEQFKYLSSRNYSTFHFSELSKLQVLPSKSIVLTFDDVTENQLLYAVPLLKKYNLKATFFIPFEYIGKRDFWNEGIEKIMGIEDLKKIDGSLIEFGYHSYHHKKYTELSDKEIVDDFKKCNQIINENDLKVYTVLAYPFGKYPRKKTFNSQFKKILSENNIGFGLKIGNRLNEFPFKDNYEIQRIDIRGEESLLVFMLKLRFGKLKLF
ncbi:polysaccharide deacetylase family protein [Flavobacterium sp. HJJ]|uniref:polysaccharide deacetylase family protein n=1 Tax=Flavobacterium sp. HJJ TaxID=2783792 RepID=UPI00188C6994|nr:polysaccharide deacetylase family protein [Flavobacterium sp. HJJ]MBF4472483.1 polysaccharide deacetylase family protein [Flavobacterium sp. HJJ]